MKKYKIIGCFALVLFIVFSCKEQSELIDELDFNREFSPLGIEVDAVNHNSATISWEAMKGSTERFVAQLFQSDSLAFEGTPVVEQTVEFEYKTVFSSLLPEVRYSVRIKTIGNSSDEDSKWHAITFKTASYQGLVSVKNIKATKAIVNWKTGETATALVFSTGGQADISVGLDAADLAAASKSVTGLLSNKTYTVSLMDGVGRKGKLSFKTMYSPLYDSSVSVTELNSGDDLAAAITGATPGAVLVLPDGYTYSVAANITLPGAIQIFGDPDAEVMPVIYGTETSGGKALFVLANASKVYFNSVAFAHHTPDANGCSIIDQQTKAETTMVDSLVLDNCKISGFGRALVRLRASAEADMQTISNLIINNCVIDNMSFDGSNGYFLGDNTYGHIVHAAITNSTLSNIGSATGGAHTFNVSKVGTNFDISNCTFYNVIGGNGTERFLITSKSGYTAAFANSIFGKTNGNESVYPHELSATDEAGLTGNGNFKTTDWLAGTASGGTTVSLLIPQMTSTGGSAADLFEDPANGNFTLKSSVPSAVKSAGDPRWW